MQRKLDEAIRRGDVQEAHYHFTALMVSGYWFEGSSTWSAGKLALARAGSPLDKDYKLVKTQIEKAAKSFMRSYLGLGE